MDGAEELHFETQGWLSLCSLPAAPAASAGMVCHSQSNVSRNLVERCRAALKEVLTRSTGRSQFWQHGRDVAKVFGCNKQTTTLTRRHFMNYVLSTFLHHHHRPHVLFKGLQKGTTICFRLHSFRVTTSVYNSTSVSTHFSQFCRKLDTFTCLTD